MGSRRALDSVPNDIFLRKMRKRGEDGREEVGTCRGTMLVTLSQ